MDIKDIITFLMIVDNSVHEMKCGIEQTQDDWDLCGDALKKWEDIDGTESEEDLDLLYEKLKYRKMKIIKKYRRDIKEYLERE